jgi:hypothetical protein
MAGYDEFWGRAKSAAPGMLDLGLGMWGQRQAQAEGAQRLRNAQGPAYQAGMAAASMDPNAAASQEFNAQHSLLAGVDAKTETDLMRMLRAKGMLGAASYNPGIEGVQPSGTAMNPHMAAYYAARNARDAKMAAGAREAADRRQTSALGRANTAQTMGMRGNTEIPSRSAANLQLLKGASGVLKDTGMLDMGMDWLKKTIGGGGDVMDMFGDTDFTWGF